MATKLPKWEYKIIEREEIPCNGAFLILINQLGEDGWELVDTCHICQPPYEAIRLIFKREIK